MKQFRLVLNGKPGEWLNAKDVSIETFQRTGKELVKLGYKNWYVEWR